MYPPMLMFGANIYTPAGFVNVKSGNETNLSLNISCIFLPVVILNVVLSLPTNYILIGNFHTLEFVPPTI